MRMLMRVNWNFGWVETWKKFPELNEVEYNLGSLFLIELIKLIGVNIVNWLDWVNKVNYILEIIEVIKVLNE